MKLIWMIVGGAGAMIVLTGLAAWLVGTQLPEAHTATVSADVDASPDMVAARIRDIAGQADWRADVQRIEMLGEESGVLRYVEHGSNGRIPFAFREIVPGQRFTSTIDTDSLPFGGSWTITLDLLGGTDGDTNGVTKTRVTIREDGVVRPPVFRTISRYVMGHTGSIDAYLRALVSSFPERR